MSLYKCYFRPVKRLEWNLPSQVLLVPWVAFISCMWSSWRALHLLLSVYSNEYSFFFWLFSASSQSFCSLGHWQHWVHRLGSICTKGNSAHFMISLTWWVWFFKAPLDWKINLCQRFFFSSCQIFTRILRSLNLPVGSNQVVVPRFLTNAYDVGHAVMWITAMMVSNCFIKWNKHECKALNTYLGWMFVLLSSWQKCSRHLFECEPQQMGGREFALGAELRVGCALLLWGLTHPCLLLLLPDDFILVCVIKCSGFFVSGWTK